MKVKEKTINKIASFLAFFLINLLIFSLSAFIVKISFLRILLFSITNGLWMSIFLQPFLNKFNNRISKKENKKRLKPLIEYIENVKKRQIEIENEVEAEEKEIVELLKIYKYDWKLFNKFIKKRNVKGLYHFTDKQNINSIIENGGLHSWVYCLKNNIEILKPGGDDLSRKLDKSKNLENYVRLSFTSNHPMMYSALKDGRLSNPVILEIKPEVIYWKKTKFSNVNATKNNAKIGETFEDFEKIKVEMIKEKTYLQTDDIDKPFYQAEVLVYEKIPLKFITNIYSIENK